MADIDSLSPLTTTRIRRQDDVLFTDLAGQVVMIDPEKGLYFELDAIGTDIWQRLAAPIVVADLVTELARDYQASLAEIERDVLALLSRMAEYRLVTEC